MTMNMILALGILVFMLVLIMTDALPFGAPPILASLLIVVFGLVPEDASAMGYAMAGFSNNTVWMVAFFMAILGAVQKTSAIEKVRQAMLNLVEKGGFKSYVLLIIVVMLGTTLVGSGQTAYYVLILSLVATIPYNKNLPSSKLMLPLGFATNHPLIPINVALFYGVMASVLESAGESGTVSMVSFAIVNAFISAGFLIWAIIGYKVLPDHEIAAATEEQEQRADAEINQMDAGKEKLAIAMFVIAIVGTFRGKKHGKALAIVAVVLSVLAIIITLAMQSAASKAIDDAMGVSTSQTSGDSSSKKSDAKKTESKGEQDMEGDLKSMHVKIVSAVRSGNDYENNPTVLVTYEWTNNTKKNNSFAVLANPKVFQNGSSLDTAIYTDAPAGYDASSYLAEVQPGATATVTIGYVLKDDSAVTVDVTDFISMDDSTKVKHVFTL